MTPKMQPFWWFLKPPSPACWRNSCENCADWTKDAEITCSVDNVNYKEGSGSIKLSVPAGNGVENKQAYISVGPCDRYLGFWVRPNMPNQPSFIQVSWIRADLDIVAVQISNLNRAPLGRNLVGVIDRGGHSAMYVLQPFTDLSWYWIEIYDSGTLEASTYYWRVNGAQKWSYATAPAFGDPAIFHFRNSGELGMQPGEVNLDFIRRATKLEYPPT